MFVGLCVREKIVRSEERKKEKKDATKPRNPMWKGKKRRKKKRKGRWRRPDQTRPDLVWKEKKKRKRRLLWKEKEKKKEEEEDQTHQIQWKKKKKSKVTANFWLVGPSVCV